MAKIDAKMVKELRERTGAGMMDCKKALSETDGDMDKAIDYLREKGIAKAEKKAGRIASEGVVAARRRSRKLSPALARRFPCAASSAMRTLRDASRATSTWAARSACSSIFRAARLRSARTLPCTSRLRRRRQSTVRA